MNVETITSRQNALMTHLRKLASSRSYRKKSGEYVCDGTKLLDEALKWGAPVRTAVFSDGITIPALPEGVRAMIKKDSYEVPAIFHMLREDGRIEEQMMYNTYNMGLGMVLAVAPEDVDKTMEAIKSAGDKPYVVGKIENGEKGVTLC